VRRAVASGYLEHSAVTAPGPLRPLLAELPDDVEGIRAMVPGLVIHAAMGDLYGADLGGRAAEARLRTLPAMLARIIALDPRPLTEPRPPALRLVGNCRASTVLVCGLLREASVPARARCGFSGYFASSWPVRDSLRSCRSTARPVLSRRPGVARRPPGHRGGAELRA
jgi:hypothetical protein